MNIDTNAENDRAIREAADKLIAAAAAKNGITIDQIPQSAKDDAYRFSRESVESNARNQSNEYYHLYEAQKKENAALQAQLGAVRENRAAKADTRTVDTMEQVRSRLGHAAWFQLSEAQKLNALGLDNTVDREQLRRLFGRNTDTAYAVDFMKTNPYRYKQLRQASLALNITGK